MQVFSSREEEEIHIIAMPMIMDHTNLGSFEAAASEWIQNRCSVHVMDLANLFAIMPSAHKSLIHFNKELRERDKSLFSIHASEKLLGQLKRDGLFAILNPVENLEVVQRLSEMKRAKKEESRSRLLADIINSFDSAIEEIFRTNIGLDPITETPYLKNVGESYLFEVGSSQRIEIDNFEFSAAIQFDRKVFEKVYDYYLDHEHQVHGDNLLQEEEAMKKAAKKIMLPVFNFAALKLKEKNRIMAKHFAPEILTGDKLQLHKDLSAIVVEFLTAVGSFHLEVASIK